MPLRIFCISFKKEWTQLMGHLDSYENFEYWDFCSEVEYSDMIDGRETTDVVLQGKSTSRIKMRYQ